MCSDARRPRWMAAAALLCVAFACAVQARAGGPRFVTSTFSSVGGGIPIPFYTSAPAYYTDPGNLGATVSHAQADAMVAAAAATWSVSQIAVLWRSPNQITRSLCNLVTMESRSLNTSSQSCIHTNTRDHARIINFRTLPNSVAQPDRRVICYAVTTKTTTTSCTLFTELLA